jgi:hypothetical protein
MVEVGRQTFGGKSDSMRRRRPASMSTIANLGTGSKSRLVLLRERQCARRADYAVKSAKWAAPSRLLQQATLSFIVDVEVPVS